MKNDKVFITCYGQRREYDRKDAIKEFFEGMCCCEGAEKERYTNIYIGLINGEKEIVDLEYDC